VGHTREHIELLGQATGGREIRFSIDGATRGATGYDTTILEKREREREREREAKVFYAPSCKIH